MPRKLAFLLVSAIAIVGATLFLVTARELPSSAGEVASGSFPSDRSGVELAPATVASGSGVVSRDSAPAPVASEVAPVFSTAPEVAGAWYELESDPPPYPWPLPTPPDPSDHVALYDRTLLTVNFHEAPFLATIAYLGLRGLPPARASERVRAFAEEKALLVHLRVKGVTARNVLDLLVATKDDLCYSWTKAGPWIHFKDEVCSEPFDPPTDEGPSPGEVLRDLTRFERPRRDTRWRDDLQVALEDRRITFAFDETPLSEVVDFLHDVSDRVRKTGRPGPSIILSRAIDGEAIKIDLSRKNVTLRESLDAVCEAAGVAWGIKHGTIFLAPREESGLSRDLPPPETLPSPLRDRPISIDVRGVNVAELVGAFAAQGIEAIASERAWRSRGTCSFVARDVPLWKALLQKRRPLRIWIDWDPRSKDPREVVVIDVENEWDERGGERGLTSMRDALGEPVPPVRDLERQVAEERRALIARLEERRRLRVAPDVDPAELARVEAEADEAGRHVLAVLASVRELASGSERAVALRAEVLAEEDAIRAERDRWVAEARRIRLRELQTALAVAEKDAATLAEREAEGR